MRTWVPFFAFWVTAVNLLPVPVCPAMPSSWPPIQETVTGRATARPLGTIKIMAGNVITRTPDYGPEIGVIVEAATRVIYIAPQEKTLNYATPVQLKNLQVGDRILLAGKACDDAKAIVATSVGVMKRCDLKRTKIRIARIGWRADSELIVDSSGRLRRVLLGLLSEKNSAKKNSQDDPGITFGTKQNDAPSEEMDGYEVCFSREKGLHVPNVRERAASSVCCAIALKPPLSSPGRLSNSN